MYWKTLTTKYGEEKGCNNGKKLREVAFENGDFELIAKAEIELRSLVNLNCKQVEFLLSTHRSGIKRLVEAKQIEEFPYGQQQRYVTASIRFPSSAA
jgi:hypothetical protein